MQRVGSCRYFDVHTLVTLPIFAPERVLFHSHRVPRSSNAKEYSRFVNANLETNVL